jgi:hypothetical protein
LAGAEYSFFFGLRSNPPPPKGWTGFARNCRVEQVTKDLCRKHLGKGGGLWTRS